MSERGSPLSTAVGQSGHRASPDLERQEKKKKKDSTALWDSVIRPHWAALVAQLQPSAVKDLLYQNELLTREQYVSVPHKGERASAVSFILRQLSQHHRTNPVAIHKFVQLLSSIRGQQQLAALLQRQLDLFEKKCAEEESMSTGQESCVLANSEEASALKKVSVAIPKPDTTVDDDSVYSDDVSDSEMLPYRVRASSLHESRCYSPRQVEETSFAPDRFSSKPLKIEHREQLLKQAKELDRLQENLLETLHQLKGSNPNLNSQELPVVATAPNDYRKGSLRRVQGVSSDESETDGAQLPLARDSLQLEWDMVRRTDKSYLVQTSPRGSTVNPATALNSMLQVEMSESPSRASLSSGGMSRESVRRESVSSLYRNSESSHNQSVGTTSITSSHSPSPVVANVFSSDGVNSKVLVSTSSLELWMMAWIREYLEVEPDFIDIFQLTLPGQESVSVNGPQRVAHFLVDDLTLSQFRQQRAELLLSLAGVISAPKKLQVIGRQVNEHAILVSLWLPKSCCEKAVELAEEREVMLTSLGVGMVQTLGKRMWCVEDRRRSGWLSKLKVKLQRASDDFTDLNLEVNVDKTAMELWKMMGAIPNPLYHAVVTGSPLLVKTLLAIGVDMTSVKDGETVLHVAAQLGHVEVTDVLLSNGANANVRNESGMTPLHWAANQGNVRIADMLLARGADIDATDSYHEATPLHVAAMMGFFEVVDLLLDRGADQQAVDRKGRSPLHLAVLFAPDNDGDTERAESFSDVVENLLRHEMEISTPRDLNWITPLHLAAAQGQEYLVDLLVKYGMDTNAVEQQLWQTPLHFAAAAQHTGCVSLLLSSGASAAAMDKNGKTPSDLALSISMRTMLATSRRNSLLFVESEENYDTSVLCVVGESGSGKTTLVQSLCAFSQSTASRKDIIMETATSRLNCFRLRLTPDCAVTVRDAPAITRHHIPYSSFVGGYATVFVVVLHLNNGYNEMLSSTIDWLQLIAHSARVANCKPPVLVVGSHGDKQRSTHVENSVVSAPIANAVLEELREQFSEELCIHDNLVVLDCRRPFAESFQHFVDKITELSKTVQERCPLPKLCGEIMSLLPELQCQYAVPLVGWTLFGQLVEQQIKREPDMSMLKHVVSYLHDMGQVVVVPPESSPPSLLVLEPDWLFSDGFGSLLSVKRQQMLDTDGNGRVARETLRQLFIQLPCDVSVLLRLLEFCGLCFPHTSEKLVYQLTTQLPSTGQRWWHADAKFTHFAGRQFELEEGTFPASFGQQLQVRAHKMCEKQGEATVLTLWLGGFKYVTLAGNVEVMVQLLDDRSAVQVVVRGAENSFTTCCEDLHKFCNFVLDSIDTLLPGLHVITHCISSWQLQRFHVKPEMVLLDDVLSAWHSGAGYLCFGASNECLNDLMVYPTHHWYRLPEESRAKLCHKLNTQVSGRKLWLGLAEQLQVPAMASLGPLMADPAGGILGRWARNRHNTLDQLQKAITVVLGNDMKWSDIFE